MIFAIFFAIFTGVLMMVTGVVSSMAAKRSLNLSFILGLSSVFLAIICFILLKGQLVNVFWVNFFVFAAGAGNFITFLLIELSMRTGNNGIVWALANSALIFPFLTGILIFGVEANLLMIIGAVLIVAGIITAGFSKNSGQKSQGMIWFFWALLSFFVGGATQSCANIPAYLDGVEQVTQFQKGFVMQLGMISAAVVTLPFNGILKLKWRFSDPVFRANIGVTLLSTLANGLLLCYFLYKSFDLLKEAGVGAIAYPLISGTCISVFFLYSLILLREKMSLLGWFSFLLTLGGIVVITL